MLPFIKVVFFDLGMTLVDSATKQFIPGAKALLAKLKEDEIRLGIISNTGNLTRAQLRPLLPPDFDFAVFEATLILLSSEVGIQKPNLEIFRKAVSNARVASEQCLYCSEDLLETIAAQRAGMRSARIQPPPNGDLEKLVDAIQKASALS
jgi:putative hydrolase of the HAD superfamily